MILAGLIALFFSIITSFSHSIDPFIISTSGFAAFYAHQQAKWLGLLAVNLNLVNLFFADKIVFTGLVHSDAISRELYYSFLISIQLVAVCIYIWKWALDLEYQDAVDE